MRHHIQDPNNILSIGTYMRKSAEEVKYHFFQCFDIVVHQQSMAYTINELTSIFQMFRTFIMNARNVS